MKKKVYFKNGKEEIKEIQNGLEDVGKGRIYPIEAVAKELGITLK